MKRKDFEDISHNFSSSSRKCRRLDGELFPLMQEDPGALVPKVVEEGGLSLDPSAASTSMVQTSSATDLMPLANSSEQMAMVVYCPHTTPFVKSPSSPEFSIIVNSDLIPSLKDHIFWPRNSTTLKLEEDELATVKGRERPDDSLALVPWVASPLPATSLNDGQTIDLPEPMEAEEVEMMDTEDTGTGGGNNEREAYQMHQMARGDGLQQWQQQNQHCMAPQILQNAHNPVTW